MEFRKQRGTTLSLVLAAHPLPALVMTIALAGAAALTGRSLLEVGLVAATVLCGQLTVGWLDDVVDRHRDKQVGRRDRPVALEWVDPGTVTFSIAVVVLVLVPLSIANGTYAGLAYLASVAALWLYHAWFKKTLLSWLPWLASFGLLPAFLSYGGLGGGMHGGPPTWAMTVLAALLGVGVHFLTTLPDLVQDNETGVRHLPLRIALRIGAPKLLWVSMTFTALVAAGIVVAGLTVGVRR
ncbi:MAG TPA: UbiA family prenyltransferase [Nocardioidaceae bacterium]|nr:UbiA family prenyltransferase [Nocardioidaceae bacterium]